MIKQFNSQSLTLHTQSSCVQLRWCSLPVCLPCELGEDIVMAINVHHSILQEKLPPILDTTYLCVCARVRTHSVTKLISTTLVPRLYTCREVVCFLTSTKEAERHCRPARRTCTSQHVSSLVPRPCGKRDTIVPS